MAAQVAGHRGGQVGVEAGGGETAAGHFRINASNHADAAGDVEFIGGEIEAGDRVVMRARRLRRRGVGKCVRQRAARQFVRAQAADDDEVAIRLRRAVEGQHVTCAQRRPIDPQCLARSHRRVVGGQGVAVARRELQLLHIDHRRGAEDERV